MKGLSALHRSRTTAVPPGQLAGEIALNQKEHKRQLLVENPRGSELFTLPAWEQVQQHLRV
eukprot:4821318-Prorocentrum_lima.AAC.1